MVARRRQAVQRVGASRAWRDEFLNELSELRASVLELGDGVAADLLTHALVCFVKGKDETGAVWLRMTLEHLG